MSIEPPAPVATRSPLLAKCKSEMHAVIDVKRHLPPEEFEAWLEGGLRQARLFDGRSLATMERRMEEAVERHGSIIAAMRAGAI